MVDGMEEFDAPELASQGEDQLGAAEKREELRKAV
jgi:hypothetical protein